MQARWIARWSIVTVITAAVLAVVGGVVTAALWQPSPAPVNSAPDSCPAPPCFGGDGLPRLADLPAVAPVLLLGVAVLLGALSLMLAVIAVVRGGERRLLALAAIGTVGPLVVLVGGEVVPHLLSPCAPAELWGAAAPGVCVRTPDGFDLADRWHALDHAVVGFVPLALALAWRWRRLDAPRTAGE